MEPAEQQEITMGSWEGGHDGGKADWKNDCSLSSLLKHSCLLCWSSPVDNDVVETDERVLAKVADIRVRRPQDLPLELNNAVAVENLELQEQQSDRKELQETLVKLDDQKEKLVQQIKATRQLCYEESQQILSLQADEVQKESQVEEYERELARARWRLRRLREEVKQAKRKTEEAGERNTPLQDSIRQSYEEILQEEHILCSLSGGAVTPESQLEESASPADTTEDDVLPLRPWGRSQSLPAYADLIMRASSSSFCNNLADTREEADDSGTSSPKMDRSDIDDDPEEVEINSEGATEREKEECTINPNQMDFYKDNPFAICQNGFASDPFKGSDPFAADILFPTSDFGTEETGNAGDDAENSLSCGENKASTGTQCFESEFPDEDSDIEISYSREDLETIDVINESRGFKPIQSSSEELGPEPVKGWRSQGQYSVESDPNGYELDFGAISPPSAIEEHSMVSLDGKATDEAPAEVEQDFFSVSPQRAPDQVLLEPDWMEDKEQSLSCDGTSSQGGRCSSNNKDEIWNPVSPQHSLDSQNLFIQPNSDENKEISFELSYEQTSQSSFDPYGFKLSPEHSNQTLLDPDEAEISPEPSENDRDFDPEGPSSQPDQVMFDPYGLMVQECDPYGFKLSPEEENQEVLELCGYDNPEAMDLCAYEKRKQVDPSNYKIEVLDPHTHENQEVLDHYSYNNQDLFDLCNNGNQEVLEHSSVDNSETVSNENLELLCGHDNQEVVESYCSTNHEDLFEHFECGNQETLELCSHGNRELLDFSHTENQEVPDLDSHGNQELLDCGSKVNQEVLLSGRHNNQELLQLGGNENQELLDSGSNYNQEMLDLLSKAVIPEANNNCTVEPESSVTPTNNSFDSIVAKEDFLGLKFGSTNICTTNTSNTKTADTNNMSTNQDLAVVNAPIRNNILESDLGAVFGAGGYIGCPDVADDLEPLEKRSANPIVEPVRSVRPVRPPRPSLKAKEKAQSHTEDIDLK
ncbi:uncharacterized protein LOC133967876 isoform X2 [Platichthys flesus]|uniref:uncharacterized protein LOC133967876 isoform X2 n=1 Tax=Platichthys flesus TaxID=8260 RepID=UPI002DB88C6B|nr:uncharacterized protein LOC133967876 isoform X2 [Platichthys flesus]